MDQCKHCNSTLGFYVNDVIVHGNVISCYNFDGTEGDNSAMFDGLTTKPGKDAYCLDCDGYVGKTKDLLD